MSRLYRIFSNTTIRIVLSLFLLGAALATVSTTLNDFTLSGSQSGESGTITKACNCHGGFNIGSEPEFNWAGGMMAHAARDPLWMASMAVAERDAAFAGDLCIRCHSPKAWLEGRSTPTDGSALTSADRESVQCEFCHRMVPPFAQGTNPYTSDSVYTSVTYPRDTTYLGTLSDRVVYSGNGMFAVDNSPIRRGPRTLSEVSPSHQGSSPSAYYSPFHRDAALCGTCHDVSNPAFTRVTDGEGHSTYVLNDLDTPPPSMSPYDQFPVERTFSEWKMSAYNSSQGVYAPQFGGTKDTVRTCQDCHMRDVAGKMANSGSTRSDIALHDQTGGNTFVPLLVKALYASEVNAAAIDSGISRARSMLRKAASLQAFVESSQLRVRVTNETGHKLPSGYPEGRRMWLNVKFLDGEEQVIAEHGAYDTSTAVLQTSATKVYEVKLGMSAGVRTATGKSNGSDGSSFHFVLNNVVVKDNRIPPRGFTNAAFRQVQSPPVGTTYDDGQYWDDTVFPIPDGAVHYVASLYYQTTSKEYATFLDTVYTDNPAGDTFYAAWAANGKSRPELMASVQSGAPLPVVLTSFTASRVKGGVQLTWSTATEVNNFGFDVERKTLAEWENIGFVEGHGTTGQPHRYSFVDAGVVGRASYRLKQLDRSGRSEYSPVVTMGIDLPRELTLEQNHPNPFNPGTLIRYEIPEASSVKLEVYDAIGRRVAILVDGVQEAGFHTAAFNGLDLPSGMYITRLTAGGVEKVMKMQMVK